MLIIANIPRKPLVKKTPTLLSYRLVFRFTVTMLAQKTCMTINDRGMNLKTPLYTSQNLHGYFVCPQTLIYSKGVSVASHPKPLARAAK